MVKYWVPFFSQTGSEIVELSKSIGRKPNLIVTNNKDITKYHPGIEKLGVTMLVAGHNDLMEHFANRPDDYAAETIITLHGYLRIVPGWFCDKYTVYNGHPGAIDLYPELKGKDPQVRAWENKAQYKFIGSVVHRAVAEVDAGEIIKSVHFTNTARSQDETFSMLKEASLSAWRFAMKEIGL